MFVDVRVEILNHLWMVLLVVFMRTHSCAKKDHVPRSHDLVHLLVHTRQQRVVKELVAYPDPLALVERLQQMVKTAFLKGGFEGSDFILARLLQLPKEWLDTLALLLAPSKQVTEDKALLRSCCDTWTLPDNSI